MFVMSLCVLSLAATLYVMYLNIRANDNALPEMPAWVCIPAADRQFVNRRFKILFNKSLIL